MNSSGDRVGMSCFSFPSEWNDDERMNVMFAPFRDKHSYMKSWEQKMKFWTALISSRCKACDELIVDIKMLSQIFIRKGKVPCGLDVVIDEMSRLGKLKRISDYETEAPGGWISWGYATFIRNPLVWAVKKVLQMSSSDVSGQFVVVEAVQKRGTELLHRHQSSVECSLLENVLELTTLRNKYGDMFRNDQDFNIVLKQLEKDRKIIIFKSENNSTVVKFADKDEVMVSPVRDIETKVFRIQQTSELLEKEADVLNSTIERCTEEARMYLRKGLKSTALSVLRKKKKTQALLNKKLMTLDTFHGLIESIKNTVSEKMVIEAYEAASSSLKNYMKTNKISVDRVDDVLENLQEVTQDHEEIASTLSNFQAGSWDTTQDDLEAELDDILAEDSPAKPKYVSPARPSHVSPNRPSSVFPARQSHALPSRPSPTRIPEPIEVDEDYSELEDRLRKLYNPNTSPQLPEVPMFDPSPVGSPQSPIKGPIVEPHREEEPMVLS